MTALTTDTYHSLTFPGMFADILIFTECVGRQPAPPWKVCVSDAEPVRF